MLTESQQDKIYHGDTEKWGRRSFRLCSVPTCHSGSIRLLPVSRASGEVDRQISGRSGLAV